MGTILMIIIALGFIAFIAFILCTCRIAIGDERLIGLMHKHYRILGSYEKCRGLHFNPDYYDCNCGGERNVRNCDCICNIKYSYPNNLREYEGYLSACADAFAKNCHQIHELDAQIKAYGYKGKSVFEMRRKIDALVKKNTEITTEIESFYQQIVRLYKEEKRKAEAATPPPNVDEIVEQGDYELEQIKMITQELSRKS